jgi:hypothetical protein
MKDILDRHVVNVNIIIENFEKKSKFYFIVILAVTTAMALPLTHSCGLSVETGYYIDPSTKCTSNRRLRMTKCVGLCSSLINGTQSSCCKPIEPKRRFFRMTCASGFTYRQSLDFFKQCTCSTTVC